MRGAVAAFCDPVTYPSVEIVQNLRIQGIATAVRLHPLTDGEATQQTLLRFGELTRMRKVVGVGEIGLDCRATLYPQSQVMDQALELVQEDEIDELRKLLEKVEYYDNIFQVC